MKTIRFYALMLVFFVPPSFIALTTSSIPPVGIALIAVGCAHSPRVAALETLEITQGAVHEAMNVYGKAYRRAQANEESRVKFEATRARVRVAHQQFRTAFEAALMAVEFNYKQATPENVLKLKTELLAIIATL